MNESQVQEKKIRRRTFLVDRHFQLKYTMIIVLVGVVVSAILGFFIYKLTAENRELLGIDAAMMGEVEKFDQRQMFYLVGFVVAMAVFLFFWGILITHKVAGPIFIITRYLKELREGRAPRTRPLRRGDELKEFFDEFAGAVSALRQRNVEEAQTLEQLAGELEKSSPDAAARLRQLADVKKTWGE